MSGFCASSSVIDGQICIFQSDSSGAQAPDAVYSLDWMTDAKWAGHEICRVIEAGLGNGFFTARLTNGGPDDRTL
jgi:hypothetical protein